MTLSQILLYLRQGEGKVLRTVITGYIFKKKRRKNMKKILKIIFDDIEEIRMIDNNICPFCKERFKRKMGLIVHLQREYKKTACSTQFSDLVTEIIARYKSFKSVILRGSREGRVVLNFNGEKKIFKTYHEAYIYYKNYINKMKLTILLNTPQKTYQEEVKYIVF